MFDARLSSDANPITLDQAIYQNSGQRIVDCCYSPSDGYILYQRTFASEPVDILVHETRNGFFIKPANRHFKFQFEQFFGFGAGNIGYDKDRTVFVPKH
jgi:hypothetical protein